MKKIGLYSIVFAILLSIISVNLTPGVTWAASSKDTLLQLQKTIIALTKEVNALKSSVSQKDVELKSLKKQSGVNETTIKMLKGNAAVKDAALQDLYGKLSTKDSIIAANDKTIKELQKKIANYEGTTTPTSGNSRNNPAKPGETVTVEANDWQGYRNFSVTLTQAIEGPEAWSLIQAANQFNEAPKAGMKYILVKFKVKINKMDKEPFVVNDSLFNAVSSTGVLYDDFNSVVTPDPTLRTDLYVGAEHEGWAFFMVNENDHPVFVMNQKQPDEIWFKY